MAKNAISVLQEFGMKIGFMPIYAETQSIQSSLQTQFTIRVNCKNLSCDGSGPNKKEAKRKAAEGMLKLLMDDELVKQTTFLQPDIKPFIQENETIQPRTASPSSPANIENYVGQLMELCVSHSLKQPVYEVIDISGPPHNLQFKMSCTVGSMKEEALGKTKKLAKHYVSKKILDSLTKTLETVHSGNSMSPEDTLTQLGVKLMDIKLESASRPFHTLSDRALSNFRSMKKDIVVNGMTTILNYHLALAHICQCVSHQYLERFLSVQPHQNNVTEMKRSISLMLNGVECECVNLTVRQRGKYMVGIRLTTVPVLFQIGVADSKLEAEKEACYKILETILFFTE